MSPSTFDCRLQHHALGGRLLCALPVRLDHVFDLRKGGRPLLQSKAGCSMRSGWLKEREVIWDMLGDESNLTAKPSIVV